MRRNLFLGLFLFSTCAHGDQRMPVHPLAFEPTPRLHEYVSRGPGYSLRANRNGIDFISQAMPLVHLSLAGARRLDPRPTGLMPSESHYYLGRDRSHWRIGVPNYAQIRYESVYPGIDLVFYGADREFEYDFRIAPFADPARIRMRFQGAGKPTLDSSGDLVFKSGFRQHRPRVTQEGRPVPGDFKLNSNGTVSFQLASYDRSKPLTIDPVITFATFLGGSFADRAAGIAVDRAGNVLVTGYTFSDDYPGIISFGERPRFHQFAFVTKYAPVQDGKTSVLFTIFLGDNVSLTFTSGIAVAADSVGNIIAAGATSSSQFPLQNAIQTKVAGGEECRLADDNSKFAICEDSYLSKFTPDGRSLVFSTLYGGRLENIFEALAIDSEDNIYAAGRAQAPTDLNGTPGAIQPIASGQRSMQVVRFSPSGKLLYSTYLGGSTFEDSASIAVERPGVVWVGGSTASHDIPTTKNAYQPAYAGLSIVAYLARIDMNQSGAAGLTYATFFGEASGNTDLNSLSLDSSGQVVFCGGDAAARIATTSTAMQRTPLDAPGSRITGADFTAGDGYIARLNPALTGSAQLTYASYVGGTDSDEAKSCAVDSNGYLIVAGETFSDFPFWTSGSPFPLKNSGIGTNPFVIRIDPNAAGGRVDSIWFGGVDNDFVKGMGLDGNGNAYLTGYTFSKLYPVTSGAPQKLYGGDRTTTRDGIQIKTAAGFGDSWMMQVNLNGPQAAVAALAPDSGDFQFGAPGSTLPKPVVVHMTDADGNVLRLAGYTVTFTATNATVMPPQGITDGDGLTGTLVQVNGGSATITASIASPIKPYTFNAKGLSGTLPSSVAIVSGDGQSGRAGTALAQPLVVELRDANKAPLALAGLTVVFKANNATVSAANVVTDAQGRASTTVTLGTKPGDMTVTVLVGSLPAVTAKFTTAGPVLSSQSVTHSATAAVGPVCPGLLVTIYGSSIGPANLLVNSGGPDGKYSTSLADTRVLFDGVPGAIVYVSAGQTSAIVPYSVSGKASVQVVVEYQGVASNPVTVAVASSQPGLFAADSSGSGQGAIRNEDNSVNSKDNPIQRNHIAVLYGTGGGDTDPPGIDGLLANDVFPKLTQPVRVLVNGVEAEMPYAGAAPTLVAGVLQINVRIPPGTPDGNATVEVFVGDNKSPATITVAVKGD